MKTSQTDKVDSLLKRGVVIPRPETVEIGPEVRPEAISPGVMIYPGCRISGEKTLIMAGCALGEEAPVTLRNCQLGEKVKLKGGFFRESTFLQGANMGFGAQVREGCLLEEQAAGAHAVGLKQTILLPFVTLGSLINFCDCLMAGGTSRKNHSEVGSSYIHFNYTPQQDKATPSLIGDVPRGVTLSRDPIFLGGQGGLVGPCVIGYGTVIAAGNVWRKDSPEGGKILTANPARSRPSPFYPGLYRSIRRRVTNNIAYIGNLVALRRWHLQVRALFPGGGEMVGELQTAAVEKIEMGIAERIKRLGALAAKMPTSAGILRKIAGEASRGVLQRQLDFAGKWPEIEGILKSSLEWPGDKKPRDSFLGIIERSVGAKGGDYLSVIQGLKAEEAELGTAWLQSIVDRELEKTMGLLPSFRAGRA